MNVLRRTFGLLAFKTMMPIFLVGVFGISFLTYGAYVIIADHYEKVAIRKANHLAQSVKNAIRVTDNEVALNLVMYEVGEIAEVNKVVVFSGTPLIATQASDTSLEKKLAKNLQDKFIVEVAGSALIANRNHFRYTPAGGLIYAMPTAVFSTDGTTKNGVILIDFNQTRFVNKADEAAFLIAGAMFFVISVLLIIGLVTIRSHVVRPMRTIESALLAFKGGNIDVIKEIPINRTDVVGRLARGLQNSMVTLNTSKAEQGAILNVLPDMMFFMTSHGTFTDFRLGPNDDLGIDVSEIIGVNIVDFLPSDAAQAALLSIHQTVATQKPQMFEYSMPSKFGQRSYEARIVPHSEGKVIMFARDVTIRIQADKILSETKERFELALKGTSDGLWDWNITYNSIWFAPHLRELFGYAGFDQEGFPDIVTEFFRRIHPDSFKLFRQAFSRHLLERHTLDYTGRFKVESGEWKWFRIRGQAIWDAKTGKPVRMAGSFSNVTREKEAKFSLIESEKKTRAILEALPDLIFRVDDTGKYLNYVAGSHQETKNISFDSFVGQNVKDIMPPKTAKLMLKTIKDVLKTKRISEIELNCGQHFAGRTFEANVVPFKNDEIILMMRDITDRIMADKILSETQDRFNLVIEASSDGLWDWNLVSNNVWFAPRFREMLGYDPHDFEGLPGNAESFWSNLHIDDKSGVESSLEGHLKNNTPFWAECRLKTVENDYKWFTIKGQAERSAEDAPVRIAGSIADIQEQKSFELALKDSKEQLTLALDAADDGLWDWDMAYDTVYYSPRWETMLGYNEGEIVGRKESWNSLIHPDDFGEYQLKLETHLSGQTEHYENEHRIKSKSGEWIWILDRGKVVSRDLNGEPLRVVGTHADITERKQTEEELVKYAVDLEASKEAAEEGGRAKSEFLASMSHEIRTPMNGVIGMTTLLLETTLDEEQHSFVETIRSSGSSLLALINDILDYSKVEAGRLDLEEQPFDVMQAVRETVDLLSQKAKDKNILLSFKAENEIPTIIGDITRVRQVLVNLVANAVKFTDEGSVSIAVSAKETALGLFDISFAVSDTGIGIPEDRKTRLFQSFSQVDASTTRKYGGTGLGLAISQKLVNLMGGKITVESTPNEGSVFSFTIDVPVTTTCEIPSNVHQLNGNTNSGVFDIEMATRIPLRILVTEDNLVNQKVATRMLEKLGYRADIASNGLEAVEAMKSIPYDLILMDMQMPEMDGLAATRTIRAEIEADRQPWIIGVTANAMKGDKEMCFDAGMNDYVPKPIAVKDLITAISKSADQITAIIHDITDAQADEVDLPNANNMTENSIDDNTKDSAVNINSFNKIEESLGADFALELLDIFLEDSPGRIAEMHEGIKNEDVEVLQRAAHSLKSTAGKFGALRTHKMCYDLEEICREGKIPEDAVARVAEIETEYIDVEAILIGQRKRLAA